MPDAFLCQPMCMCVVAAVNVFGLPRVLQCSLVLSHVHACCSSSQSCACVSPPCDQVPALAATAGQEVQLEDQLTCSVHWQHTGRAQPIAHLTQRLI
jgi:hypothetical protein